MLTNTTELSHMPVSSLAKLYNNVTGESVKRFSTKAAGIKRIAAAFKERDMATVKGDKVTFKNGLALDVDKLVVVDAPKTAAKKTAKKKTAAKKTAAKKTAAKKQTPPGVTKGHQLKGRRQGVGAFIRDLILKNDLDIDGIVEAVHKQFPGSTATRRDVYWNRNKLRKENRL